MYYGNVEDDDIDAEDNAPKVDGYPNWEKRHPAEHPIHCPPQLLALTTTSRQLYLETRLLPFTSNMFCGHMMDLRIRLYKDLETWQIEAIGSICHASVNVSDIEFHGVAKFTGLKRIIVAHSMVRLQTTSRDWYENIWRVNLANTLRGEQKKAQVKIISREDFVQMDVREEMMAK